MKRRDFLETILEVVVGGLSFVQLTGCKDTPTIPKPEPVKTYDLELYYTRPEALTWDKVGGIVDSYLVIRGTDGISGGIMERIDDYHFKYVFYAVGPNQYCVEGVDNGRDDGVDHGSGVVGEIFDIKVVQTGITTRLNDIEQNNLPNNPYANSPKAKMACFDLKADGTVLSEGK